MGTQFPDYRLMYGGVTPQMPPQSQQTPSQQIGQVAQGLPALQGIGLLSSLYGAISAGDQAEQNYELQKKQWEDQMFERQRDRKRLEDAQRLANIYSSANYTNELGQQNKPEWAQFFRQVRA